MTGGGDGPGSRNHDVKCSHLKTFPYTLVQNQQIYPPPGNASTVIIIWDGGGGVREASLPS